MHAKYVPPFYSIREAQIEIWVVSYTLNSHSFDQRKSRIEIMLSFLF